MQTDPAWKDNLLFFEYFHGDNGAGLGAMHQTGWTALVADLSLIRPAQSTGSSSRARAEPGPEPGRALEGLKRMPSDPG